MISKKRRELTSELLNDLLNEFDSCLTISKLLNISKSNVNSWRKRKNISDKGLTLIANHPKMKSIYYSDKYADIRSKEWY